MDDPVFNLDDERARKAEMDKKKQTFAALPQNIMSIQTELGLSFLQAPQNERSGRVLEEARSRFRTGEYSGFDATKQRLFKTPLVDYRSVVFATHGYAGHRPPRCKGTITYPDLGGSAKRSGWLSSTQ